MAIKKKEYELSVWNEILGENGSKIEKKLAIIGAHDMTYLGKATSVKLQTKINGTHSLTFQMPDKYFDSEKGEYIHNDLIDYLFNERKLKLKYKDEWLEFYIKNIQESKNFKSYMNSYTCQDAFIDELSRNGYGITFSTDLYNNVEEIGTFTEEILEDSIWEYNSSYNSGDFTEYSEEKLFKIPVSQFSSICGYKLEFEIPEEKDCIKNVFTGKKRNLEMSDDKARELGYFWDNGSHDKGFSLTEKLVENIENDGYIYIPYSCLDFCYITTSSGSSLAATEEAAYYNANGISSYAIAPSSVDPTALIQFIAIPTGAEVDIDEASVIINKNYSYIMTVEQWNSLNKNSQVYLWEDVDKKEITIPNSNNWKIHGNRIAGYSGYLDSINDIEVVYGKKISITDRTEINISEEIDQYVTVYQNDSKEYEDKYSNDDWQGSHDGYRVCSKTDTRQIVPQLARNLVQNGIEITSTDGWEVMKLYSGANITESSAKLEVTIEEKVNESDSDLVEGIENSYLTFTPTTVELTNEEYTKAYNTFINFGISGQEETIQKDKIYCLGIEFNKTPNKNVTIEIGEGLLISQGDYGLQEQKSNILTFTYYAESNNTILFNKNNNYLLFKPSKNIDNPYFCIYSEEEIQIKHCYLFEAYTKGQDFFEEGNFKYSGRDLFSKYVPIVTHSIQTERQQSYHYGCYNESNIRNYILFEDDVIEGDTYSYLRYFVQQLKVKDTINADTFMQTSYLSDDVDEDSTTLPLSAAKYTDDDYEIITDYIDLNKCSYYVEDNTRDSFDCKYGCIDEPNKVCLYQKYGYCPYLFKTQKHCRKIRTLNGEKSNRFNLTQELSKVFEVYPIYYIEHYSNGKIKCDDNGKMIKEVFYITEKGSENKLGFRYEKNLSNISRTLASDSIVTKLYVEDVDSDLSSTGLCSIKTAEDNPSKDSFIIDFSYYISKGLLDKDTTEADLYGINENDKGYLKTLGYYNTKYDELTNKIINLQNQSFTELEANLTVNLEGIDTAQKELNKIKKQMDRYKGIATQYTSYTQNDTYKNYVTKWKEQKNILNGLVQSTFYSSDNSCLDPSILKELVISTEIPIDNFLEYNNTNFTQIKENWVDTHKYTLGLLGQYNAEYLQIQAWKKQRSKYLKDINRISLAFYQHYEPYLKEGTWTDSNYLTDNAYYFGAKEVAAEGAIPKVSYSITVVDLYDLPEYEDYKFEIADTTYIEDIGMFGINQKTGLPNKLKVIISEITEDLDTPTNNSINVQNYTTQFEDLFQQVTATVQSLSFNENLYKRASNFTSTQNIQQDSLQGTLDTNDLTLINTEESNINIDSAGQSGSDINNHNNQYKLNGQGLFFSNNGGQSWNVGVGPSGINADYIKVGTLDAGKIRIVDNDYLYFLWDKSGITAYREPTEDESSFSDYAKFNKQGLSLVENGIIRLRAGYDFSGDNGVMSTENDTTGNIGFYLYNSEGKKIFSTTTATNSSLTINDVELTEDEAKGLTDDEILKLKGQKLLEMQQAESSEETAKISLTGEIFVTNKILDNITSTNIYFSYSNALDIKQSNYSTYTDITDTIEYSTEEGATKKLVYLLNDFESDSTPYLMMISYILQNETPFDTTFEISDGTNSDYYTYKNWETNENPATGFLNSDLYSNYFSYDTFTFDKNNSLTKTYKCYINEKEQSIFTRSSTVSSCYILNGQNSSNTYSITKNLSLSRITYYKIKDIGQAEKVTENLYYVSNLSSYQYFKNKTQNSNINQSQEDQTVALYINNTSLSAENGQADERIFCCGHQDNTSSSNGIENILSILKDGVLYIGGSIQNSDGTSTALTELSNNIVINNPSMRLSKDGLQIDFDNLKDMSGNSLNFFLENSQGALLRHRHSISSLTGSISTYSGVKNYVPKKGQINGYENFKQCLQHISQDENSDNYYRLFLLIQELLEKGSYSYTPSGSEKGYALQWSNEIATINENNSYTFNLSNSYTDYVGTEDLDSSSSMSSSQSYGLQDIIE